MAVDQKFELRRFGDAEELAATAAREWLAQRTQEGRGAKPYCVALSGGRIARQFFEAVTHQASGNKGSDLRSVEYFWADERCVPPEDVESNYGVAQKLLLGPLQIPTDHIHRVRGELAPEEGAREAAREICGVAAVDDRGQPVLDLIFLGVGENGHVASLFPEEPESVRASPAVYRAIFTRDKPPPHRITLGYGAIAAAREVWVLASGAGKEAVVRESLSPSGQTPLARVIQSRRKTHIFTDLDIGPA